MNGLLKKVGLGIALAATALTAAAPASAQRWGRERGEWRGGGWRDHDGIGAGGAAVLGGLVGLGLGAAIASDHPYYRGGYYGAPGYYYNRPYNYYAPRCWTQWRWDPYYEQRVPVRVCN